MSVATVIAVVSVAIAATSFLVNFWIARGAAVRARRPVLVFVDDPENDCWLLQNVGNGPALNVLVAQRQSGQWFNPVVARPLAKDSTMPLTWLGRVNTTGLGATYSDFEDRRYTSTLGGERSKACDGNRFPEWPRSDIRKYWQLEPGEAIVARWAERTSSFSA